MLWLTLLLCCGCNPWPQNFPLLWEQPKIFKKKKKRAGYCYGQPGSSPGGTSGRSCDTPQSVHLRGRAWGIYFPTLFLHWLRAAPGKLETPSTSSLTHTQPELPEKPRLQEAPWALSTWEPVPAKGIGRSTNGASVDSTRPGGERTTSQRQSVLKEGRGQGKR